METVRGVARGNRKAISRAITMLEDDLPGSRSVYSGLYRMAGSSFVVGVTGAPGAGKSTLVNCLVREYRSKGEKVGVIAVDPSSPLSGGALLGDRVRMLDHAQDKGVFIRSVASRGSGGGLSRATRKVVVALDAAKYGVIFIETVGAGQTELDVMKVADTTLVVLMPQAGDEVQAIKAGLMETGDIFVMNKSDLEGADRAALQIAPFIRERDGWRPPMIKTVARSCIGTAELVASIQAHRKRLGQSRKKDSQRALDEVKDALRHMTESLTNGAGRDREMARVLPLVEKRDMDPDTAAETIIGRLLGGRPARRG